MSVGKLFDPRNPFRLKRMGKCLLTIQEGDSIGCLFKKKVQEGKGA